MFGKWRSHGEYQKFLIENVKFYEETEQNRLLSFDYHINKLTSLNLDPLCEKLAPFYSKIGRPATLQAEIFRSFILMFSLKITSITNWSKNLKSDNLLAFIIGCSPDNLPSLGAYYDFINRLWLCHNKIDIENRKRTYTFNKKPHKSKEPGKNKKLPNKNAGIVHKIVRFYVSGRSFEKRYERLIQEVFSLIAVVPSLELGLISKDSLIADADGTCVHSHTSSRGIKVCECRENGIYDCKCNRRFADPDAAYGWDSDLGTWYYGHTLYAISTYNKEYNLDLPLYLRYLSAKRHDSVSGVVALAEFRELNHDLKIRDICFDSANDNYDTYQLCKTWDIRPFIDLNNKRGVKPIYPTNISITDNGTPICIGGHEMKYNGYCKNRSRHKWRCPIKCGLIDTCSSKENCSKSDYGRVIYTKPTWDLRIFTPVPRGTKEYKEIYKTRTCSERINNRILNDYNLHKMQIRGKKRYSFFTMIIGINIHLDARLKKSNIDNKIII